MKDEDIKKMYYEMAKKFHPDQEAGSEERFKRVGEAYDILGDKSKRADYDQMRSMHSKEMVVNSQSFKADLGWSYTYDSKGNKIKKESYRPSE